jgi:hypothetical protein
MGQLTPLLLMPLLQESSGAEKTRTLLALERCFFLKRVFEYLNRMLI